MHRIWAAARNGTWATGRRGAAAAAAAGGLCLLLPLVSWAADGKSKKPDAPPKPPVIVEPLPAEVLAEALRAEQDAYIRRLDVCTKLRQIAAEKNNDKLARQATDLELAATTLYEQRVAKLGVKASSKPSAAAGDLDKKLGSGAAVNPLTVAAPKPASASLAELREVKP